MAFSKSSLSCLVAIFLFTSLTKAHAINTEAEQQHSFTDSQIDCGAECARRCALSSRPNLCHRACGTCCARCNCVPPGTFGHYEACPCYANMTTHNGRKKCP